MTGFVMVFEEYDYCLLVTFVIQQGVDFVFVEILLSGLLALNHKKGEDQNGCYKMLYWIQKIRGS